MLEFVFIANRAEITSRVSRALPSLPSMGRVAAKRRGGVRAPALKALPNEAQFETSASLTPSVTLRVTAPPSKGSGSAPC